MTVRTHTYIMFGINLDPDAIESKEDPSDATVKLQDNWREQPKPFDEISVVYDGMCGKFLMVGFIHTRTDETGHFDGVEALVRIPKGERLEAQQRITAAMAECGITIDPQTRPKWHIFTHYH
jgi:hypothetical protein